MAGPYLVRIVQLDGVERYLGHGRLKSSPTTATAYAHPSAARRAAKKYIGDMALGTYYADIIDSNDHEGSIEL